ncbi:hypothetical protein CDAR_381971 [Caerostris darwini]|uniref:Uncharacterized protein n=1 Tax=Caerostris darwini TaxID=1538125 RepID=A0AAV4V550_9ARAC|nr:hypothetical protein CDAR_381971 [Caerostris darwini]
MMAALRLDKLNYAFSALETSTSGAIAQGREASLQLNSAVLFQVPIQELIRNFDFGSNFAATRSIAAAQLGGSLSSSYSGTNQEHFLSCGGKEVFATILGVCKVCFIPVAVWGKFGGLNEN